MANHNRPSRVPSTEGVEGGTEETGISTEEKVDTLIATALDVRVALNRRTAFVIAALVAGFVMITITLYQTREIKAIGKSNRDNGELLVNCVTPGPNPPPLTGNECWDRLHSSSGTDTAIAVILDNVYCDHRRAQAKLPPSPDPKKSCREQTPEDVLNGVGR